MNTLPALPFVPVGTVTTVFDVLYDNNTFHDEAQEIINYFEDTRIRRSKRRHV